MLPLLGGITLSNGKDGDLAWVKLNTNEFTLTVAGQRRISKKQNRSPDFTHRMEA